MTAKTDVTNAQGVEVARMARSKGVMKVPFQESLEEKGGGPIGIALDAIKTGARIQILESSCRQLEDLKIQIPALPRPTLEELQGRFGWIKSIHEDNSPTKASTMTLGTVLRLTEYRIDDEEYTRRREGLPSLGYQHGVWLAENQDNLPELMAQLGRVYIDLPGIEVVDADGRRRFPYLSQCGGRWGLGWFWSDRKLFRDGRLAVHSK